MAEKHPELSRSYIAKLIDAGEVLVNNEVRKPGYRLREHDSVKELFKLDVLQKIEDIDLPILYEDDNVMVIDKPAGVISHSRGKYWYEPSVASFVRQKTGEDSDRAGIVHRLDRATSGVMITAKNSDTLKLLQKQFGERTVKKHYTAVVTGHISPAEAIIDMPIERNPKTPATFRVGSNGKEAQTHYKVLRSSEKYDMVKLKPKTGRTHQLRVHLKHIGHPIVGDMLYDGENADRLYLHAGSLELTFQGGVRKTFTSPLPAVFTELVPENESE